MSTLMLTWIFYTTTAEMIWIIGRVPLPTSPVVALEPFRIANQYGLFAVMTRGRYEIEFQGSDDGQNWVAYPFRYKPQDLNKPPGIYAPHQPRLDWNLWFASLGSWREYPIVPNSCWRVQKTCWRYLPEIRFRKRRQNRFVRYSGNIGLPPWLKNVPPVAGGGASSWGYMRQRCNENPMAES